MKMCKNAKKYKGRKPPRCNNGNPCDYCMNVWKDAVDKISKVKI